MKREKLPGCDSGWNTIHSCKAVKGVRVDNDFQGNSMIMKESAKKHSLSESEAMQIAVSPENIGNDSGQRYPKIVSLVKQRK